MPTAITRVDLRSLAYDASDTMPCSAGAATFNEDCDRPTGTRERGRTAADRD
jgi:hypothetical protein